MMRSHRFILYAGLLASSLTTFAKGQATSSSPALVLPTDADIRNILAERISTLAGQEDGIGIVVGVIGPEGWRVISYGHLNQGDPRPLNGDTVFEIGSVSKVFTALLLAEMAQKREVSPADPVAKYLPPGIRIPERNGSPITLLDLATHTSGLPFMPDDASLYDASADIASIYDNSSARESNQKLYNFLSHYELSRAPGAEWDYSNIGYWLLSQALATQAHTDYETLLQTRIIAPLKLTSTAVTPSAPIRARLAVGHNAVLQPAPPFSSVPIYAAMPAAGGLVSTVNDMLAFLSVCMGYERSPLALSTAAMLKNQRPIDNGSQQALGWVVMANGKGKNNDQLIMHDGFTWGYASYVAWDPKNRVGVVVLSNQLTSVGDIGHHLLRPNVPLEPPTVTKHTEITLDSSILDTYVGEYEVQDEGLFRIARNHDFPNDGFPNHDLLNHDFLTIQVPPGWGLPKFRLRPESRQDFFVADLPMRVIFQTGPNGRANELLVYPPRGQHALSAKRVTSPGNSQPR
jgi:serine-type D-Ala-D-Ala carboxypeptidase/endopeptidase